MVMCNWSDKKREIRGGISRSDVTKPAKVPKPKNTTVTQRMICIGLLDHLVVLIVHVESDQELRVISMRKADSDETDLYYKNAGYF